MINVNPDILTDDNLRYNQAFSLVRKALMFLHKKHRKEVQFKGFSSIDNTIALYQAGLFIGQYISNTVQDGTKTVEEIKTEIDYDNIIKALFKCDVKVREAIEILINVEPLTIESVDAELLSSSKEHYIVFRNTNPGGEENLEEYESRLYI